MRKEETEKGQCPTHRDNSTLKVISLLKSFIIKKYPQKQLHICVYSCISIIIIMQSCFKHLLEIPKLSAIARYFVLKTK